MQLIGDVYIGGSVDNSQGLNRGEPWSVTYRASLGRQRASGSLSSARALAALTWGCSPLRSGGSGVVRNVLMILWGTVEVALSPCVCPRWCFDLIYWQAWITFWQLMWLKRKRASCPGSTSCCMESPWVRSQRSCIWSTWRRRVITMWPTWRSVLLFVLKLWSLQMFIWNYGNYFYCALRMLWLPKPYFMRRTFLSSFKVGVWQAFIYLIVLVLASKGGYGGPGDLASTCSFGRFLFLSVRLSSLLRGESQKHRSQGLQWCWIALHLMPFSVVHWSSAR